MQDVIFNGSSKRKPYRAPALNWVFDNSLGKAAGQWSSYAEISIKRVFAARRRFQLPHQQPARAAQGYHRHFPRHRGWVRAPMRSSNRA